MRRRLADAERTIEELRARLDRARLRSDPAPGTLVADEASYELLFEHSPVPQFVFDPTTLEMLAANPAALAQYGYSLEEWLALRLPDLRVREDLDELELTIAELGPGRHCVGVRRHVRRDGTTFLADIVSQEVVFARRRARLSIAIDVDERIRSQQRIAQQKRWFHALVENSSDAIGVLDPSGRLLYASESTTGVLGYSPEEHLAMPMFDRVHPDDLPRVQEGMAWVLAHPGEKLREILRFLHQDGSYRHLEVVAVNRVSDPDVGGIVCNYQDVTSRVVAEVERDALFVRERAARRFATSVLESITDPFFTCDGEWRVRYMNDAAEQLTQRPREELLGRVVWERYPELAGTAWEENARAIAREKAPRTFEAETFDGRWICVAGYPLAGGIAVTLHDITETKRAREDLDRIFALSVDVLCVIGRSGGLKRMNPAFERTFGYTPEEALSLSALAIVHPDDHEAARKGLELLAAGQHLIGFELRCVTKSGAVRRISWTSVASGPFVYASGRDITEQRALEEQLLQAQKMDAVGRLAGGVAHDFNNLLTVIVGCGQLLVESTPADDPRREDLDEIARAAERARALTGQLLAFSRRQVMQPTTIDPNDLVRRLDGMLRRLLREDVDLVSTLGPDVAAVHADASQLEQVLLNLVVNARDAITARGRITIETASVRASDAPPGLEARDWVVIAVSDDGCGMTEDVRAHVFEPFFTTKESGKGTGLGLSTVFGVVRQSGGHVLVESAPGRGSVFRVYLPVSGDAATSPVRGGTGRIDAGLQGTVLVVEDEHAVLKLVRRTLERAGYVVLGASSAEEAIRVAAEHPDRIDVLLTDVIMPELDGRALAARITAQRPSMRVVFMSGYADDVLGESGVLDEGIELVQKPLSPSLLVERIARTLARR